MSDEYTAKYDPEWEVHDVLRGDKIVVGFVQGTATTNEIVGELNRLAADNKRLRDAMSIIHKCANQLNVIEVARDALNE